MKKGENLTGRFLSLVLTVSLILTVSAGCTQNGETAKQTETEEPHPYGVLLNYGEGALQTDENGELPVKELKFEPLGAEIDGEIKAEDVALKGVFEDMKVDSVSNDASSLTVTLSGTPNLERETYSVPLTGSVEVAASHFGTDGPAHGTVYVKEYHKKQDSTEPVFWPYFDSILDDEEKKECNINIILLATSGDFAEEFSEKDVSLGLDFEGGKITAFEKADDGYEMTVTLPRESDEANAEGDDSCFGTVTLAAGSMKGTDEKANTEELVVTREYSEATLGRDLSNQDIDSIRNVISGHGDSAFTSITNGVGTGLTIVTGAYTVLGWCGLFPDSAHAEIMNKLGEIQDSINTVNDNVNYCRQVLDEHTSMLRSLGVTIDAYYLNGFNRDMSNMKTTMTEIDRALQKNKGTIEAIIDAYEEDYKNENDEDIVLKGDDFYSALYDVSGEIIDLKASHTTTIGDLVKSLRDRYDAVSGYFVSVTDESNPINAYCNMHNDLDNFATTSLDEKKLYAAEIEYQLNRAVLLISVLDGYEENLTKREVLEKCVFPKVEVANETYKEINGQKYPKCYLMNSFVGISGDVYNEIGEPMRNKTKSEIVFLSNADAAEFANRMHGRTLEEELRLAGLPGLDEAMNTQTNFPDIAEHKYGDLGWPANKNYMGIAFSYERWGLSWGKKSGNYKNASWYYLKDAYNYVDLLGCSSDNGGSNGSPSVFRSVANGVGTGAWWIVCPVVILWNQTRMNSNGDDEYWTGPDGMVFAQWSSEYNGRAGFSFGGDYPLLHFVAK